jgi:DNA replication protein DnaC
MESLGGILKRIQAQASSLRTEGEVYIESPPDPNVLQCSVCSSRGFVRHDGLLPGDERFGKALPCPLCGPLRRQQAIERMMAHLTTEERALTFESFEIRQNLPQAEQDALAHAKTSAMGFAIGGLQQKWVLLTGSYGWGKTHLALAILNARFDDPDRGPLGIFKKAPDLLGDLRAGYKNDTFEQKLTHYQEVPLLVLDEVGGEYHRGRGSDEQTWAAEQLLRILDHRYLQRMETVLTTNVPEHMIDGRLRDRMLDTRVCMVLSANVPSYRTGKVTTR